MRKKNTITMMQQKKSSEPPRPDHGAIDRRLRTLQKIVPGGKKMEVHTLFQETADYILNLQMQVHGSGDGFLPEFPTGTAKPTSRIFYWCRLKRVGSLMDKYIKMGYLYSLVCSELQVMSKLIFHQK